MNSNDHILFNAGASKLCVAAASVHCIHEGLMTQAVPDTQPWFAGIAVVDGRLLPVTDLGAYLDGIPAVGRVLELNHKLGMVGLRVDDIINVSGDYDEQEYQLVDVAELVQSARFLDIQSQSAWI